MEKEAPFRKRAGLAAQCLLPRAAVALATAFLAAGVAMVLAREVAIELAPEARLSAPEPGILLFDRKGRFLDEVEGATGAGFGYWPLPSLPPRVVAATLAAEDRRFFSHPGVDPLALLRAAFQNMRSGRRVSGASTLAMQVARMQEPGPRTPKKKIREILQALALVRRHGREAVLSHYLRIVPYGNRIHGIGYAARRYFGKPVEDLSWAEIAVLAAIPQAPGRMNPCTWTGRCDAVARGKAILRTLTEQGALPPDEYAVALDEIRRMDIPPLARRPVEAMHAVLAAEERLKEPRFRNATRNRPLVTLSLDLDLQKEAVRIVGDALRSWENRSAGNAALIVADRASGEVLAYVGSSGYFDDGRTGAIDYARVPRPAGSTLKPLLYACALDRGIITPATVLDDLRRGPGSIENSDALFLGPLLPREALANSRNVPAARLLEHGIGIEEGYAFLGRVGLHRYERPPRHYGAGLAVGALPVTLERLVRAYTALAGDGSVGDLVWMREMPRPSPRKVLSEASSRQVALFLSDPMARLPSFPRMGGTEFAFPVAVKTGTSAGYRDAWVVAHSTKYLVGVWVGNADAAPMKGVSGHTAAAGIAQPVLSLLHAGEGEGLNDHGFPPPGGFRPVNVCALTGERATASCSRVFTEWFRPGREPVIPCRGHVQMAIDARSGRPAAPSTPLAFVDVRTFTDLDPRYAAWAAAEGLPRPPDPMITDPSRDLEAGRIPALSGSRKTRVNIVSPESGVRYRFDPEMPPNLTTVALEAVVEPPVAQVVWFVDGAPYKVVDYPYTTRWPVKNGEHSFQVRLPFTDAASVTVTVRVQ